MKKTFKYIMLGAAAVLSAACTEELNNENVALGEEITISAGVFNGADTKVNFTDDLDTKKVIVNWNESGEAFTAFIDGTPSAFAQAGAPDGDGKAVFSGNLPAGATPASMLYAIYPESSAAAATAVAIDLSRQTGKVRDEKNTYMYGSSSLGGILTSGLTFHHLGSVVKATLSFTDAQGGLVTSGTVKNVSFTATDLVSKATVDLTQAAPAVSATENGNISLSGEFELDAEGKAVVYLHVLPATLSDLMVSAVVGEKTYVAEIGGRTDGKAMEAGKQYGVSATCAEAASEESTDYYVTVDGSGSGASWSDPTTLTNALAAAPKDATIHVAAGTYYPDQLLTLAEGATNTTDAAKGWQILRPVTVIGGYPENPTEGATSDPAANKTILDGKKASYHVLLVAARRNEGEVVLKGLTITGGSGAAKDADATAKVAHIMVNDNLVEHTVSINSNHGGGIAAMSSNLKLENVDVVNNDSYKGTQIFALNTNLDIKNCTLSGESNGEQGFGILAQANTNYNVYIKLDACKLNDNISKGERNNGAFVLNANGGAFKDVQISNSEFIGNIVKNGAAIYLNAVDNLVVSNTIFKDNSSAGGNGTVFLECKKTKTNVLFIDSVFENNYTANNSSAVCPDLNGGQGLNVQFVNCDFINNKTGQRGPFFVRSRGASGSELNAKYVNCTFSGNNGGTEGGSAICLAEDSTPLNVDIISCTITGNSDKRTNDEKMGAIFIQVGKNTTLNIYNSIISGNTHHKNEASSVAADVCITSGGANKGAYMSSIIGATYYNAAGAETAVTPVFDFATMLNGCKLVGDASTNPAFGNGSTMVELEALADETVTAAILKKDQAGNDRTDADKIIGALVK